MISTDIGLRQNIVLQPDVIRRYTVVPYTFEYHYNRYANAFFMQVFKSQRCVIHSRKMIHGVWPVIDDLVQDIDLSRVPAGRRLIDFEERIEVNFYRAFKVNRQRTFRCNPDF